MNGQWLGYVTGRILVAALFVPAGFLKLVSPQPFLEHMMAFGVDVRLLPFVGAFEVCTGLAMLVGIAQRSVALSLALFCVLTAIVFHMNWDPDSAERALFAKNIALAGGLLMIGFSNRPNRYLSD